MYRGTFIALLVLGLALVAASCGSSDGNDTAQAEPLTKAAFIKKADAICDAADKDQVSKRKAYLQKNPSAESTEAGRAKAVIAVGLPPLVVEAEEIAALGAPVGDQKEIDAIVKSIEKAVEEGKKNPGDLLSATARPFARADKLAAAYGLKACSSSS